MKRILVILTVLAMLAGCLSCSLFASAAEVKTFYYIDAENGNDSADGLSVQTAWKTTSPLTGKTYENTDGILFKRGGVYDCSLTFNGVGRENSPFTVGAYGNETDALPLLTTNERADVLTLNDCCYFTIENLEITAHNGGGIYIDTLTKASEYVTVSGLTIHDIQNDVQMTSRDNISGSAYNGRAGLLVKGFGQRSRFPVNNLTVENCEMYDCGNGVILWGGSWNDALNLGVENEDEIEPVFGKDNLVKGCYFHDMDAEACLIGICDNALVTDCRAIDCCQGEGTDENGSMLYYNASMWFWGSVNSVFDHCEISGQKNVGDGMTVDFDSYSHNCTYQYIYSHDNVRFMNNNPRFSGHHGNTVRYCLSVNDGTSSSRLGGWSGEWNINFYNNTIIGGGTYDLTEVHDAVVANNIFMPADGYVVKEENPGTNNNLYCNNCFYNCLKPVYETDSMFANPGFVSDNTTDVNSYKLYADSPLIGAGYDTGCELEYDFFGNKITSCNIGCYGGNGEGTGYEKDSFLQILWQYIRLIFKILKAEIDNTIFEAKDYYHIHIEPSLQEFRDKMKEYDITNDYSFKIDTENPGDTIGNKVSNVNLWDMGKTFYGGANVRYEDADITEFVRYFQFMQCSGGTESRDLFVNPTDTGVTDDYDFERLIKNCKGVLELGCKPVLKLGGVPLKYTSDRDTCVFSDNVYPPDDYDIYYEYIAALARALVAEFGKEELLTWRWGVMTEYENADWFMAKDGTPESSCEAYCKLYDYTVAALQNEIGENIDVGAHSMSVTEGLWDESDFIRHCAYGVNYYTGKTGTRITYLSASFYDTKPGQFTGGKTLAKTIGDLRKTAEECGLTDLYYGVDEGRILVGNHSGSESDALLSRTAGYTWQGAYDARMYGTCIDSNIDYFSSWDYLSGGLFSGLPTVSFHVARHIYAMSNAKKAVVTTAKKGTVINAEVETFAGFDENTQKLHIFTYNFKNNLDYSRDVDVKLTVNVPQFEDGEVRVTMYRIDDDCNWFDEWTTDRAENGITDDMFTWSPDDGCINMGNAQAKAFFNENYEKYEKCSRLVPVTETAAVENGVLTLEENLQPNTVLFFEITK